jgi:methylmalonyl-CoA mutase
MDAKQTNERLNTIVQQQGRRPRILLAHLESDQPDRWTTPLAASLAEFGLDVDIGPTRQTPSRVARLAIDNDVHMVCVRLSDITNQPLIVQLVEALKAEDGADIRLVAGGKGLGPNHEELYRAGVDLIVNFKKSNIHLIDQLLDLIDETGE